MKYDCEIPVHDVLGQQKGIYNIHTYIKLIPGEKSLFYRRKIDGEDRS